MHLLTRPEHRHLPLVAGRRHRRRASAASGEGRTASSTQNCQPAGAGGHSGAGAQPGGGDHPSGGVGQFGGSTRTSWADVHPGETQEEGHDVTGTHRTGSPMRSISPNRAAGACGVAERYALGREAFSPRRTIRFVVIFAAPGPQTGTY